MITRGGLFINLDSVDISDKEMHTFKWIIDFLVFKGVSDCASLGMFSLFTYPFYSL